MTTDVDAAFMRAAAPPLDDDGELSPDDRDGAAQAEPAPDPSRDDVHAPPGPAIVQSLPPELAKDAAILDVLCRDVIAMGIVGEDAIAAIAYLVLTSRLLDKQASLVVKGHSASGKSFVVQTVCSLFPPEALLVFTAMSSLALVFSPEPLAHRTVVIYEATALRESDDQNMTSYFLRSLLSEGRIDYEQSVKAPNGGFTTRRITKEGPTNLILTTTAVKIHGENETRMLSVTTDDSKDQTARIMHALAIDGEHGVDKQRWRDLQTWLATAEHRVTVPYAVALAELIPPVAVRLRRDFSTLLALIRAHALLHQCTRVKDGDGRIVATLADYAAVRDLVAKVLGEAAASSVSATVRETVAAVAQLDSLAPLTGAGVHSADVARALKVDTSAGNRRLHVAAAGGYLVNMEDRPRRPGRWRVGDPLPEDAQLLPDPERLRDCTAIADGPAITVDAVTSANGSADGGIARLHDQTRGSISAPDDPPATCSVDGCTRATRHRCWTCREHASHELDYRRTP